MGNEKFSKNIDRHNSSSPLSAGEIDKDQFIEALNILINMFGLQTFFYLPDTVKTKIMYLIKESYPHTISLVQQEHESRLNLPLPLFDKNGNKTFTSIAAQFFCYDD